MRVLALDAMGVIFRSADDVAELLVPFVHAKGSPLSAAEIETLYLAASLGELSSDGLWVACGLKEGLDDEYCRGHELTPGIRELMADAACAGLRIVAFTNDVSAWSRVLRSRFRLDDAIPEWVVSADIGLRKPDLRAYARLLERVGCAAGDVCFFDDRRANVDAARSVGIQAHLFVGIDDARRVVGLRRGAHLSRGRLAAGRAPIDEPSPRPSPGSWRRVSSSGP